VQRHEPRGSFAALLTQWVIDVWHLWRQQWFMVAPLENVVAEIGG